MDKIIYLDNGATTKVYSEVINEMNKYNIQHYGNPSSPHIMGEFALKKINEARKKIAFEIGAKVHEIIFTSGGTEANNLALFGILNSYRRKNKIIISSIEHSSIYEPGILLKDKFYEIAEIKVDDNGIIDINFLEKEIDSKTLIVSIIHANNEIGTIQDLRKIGALCKKRGFLFHTDAVQSFAKERINVREMDIDLLSASAHKIGGPKGVGFLYVRDGIKIKPIIIGGGQEAGRRAGTENVAGIIGFAKALEIAKKIDKEKLKKLRDYFIEELEKIGGKINGSLENRIYNNINVYFYGKDAEKIVLYLSEKGIMCSTKSACLSKQKAENRVLRAIGLGKKEIDGSLRFVLNEFITKKDIDLVLMELNGYLKLK